MASTSSNAEYSKLCFMAKKPRTFAERIQFILDEEDISQAELARRIGVTRATVNEWLSTRSQSPRADALFRIEDRLGYSARWLATGREPIRLKRLDPTETLILESFERLSETGKNAVQQFIKFQSSQP